MKASFSILACVWFVAFQAPKGFADTSQDFASWNGFLFQGTFSQETGYYLEIQSRLNQTLANGNRFIVRPAFRYFATPELSLWAGYGWLPAFSPYRSESRLWQQALYQVKLGLWQLVGRFRLDERWLADSDGVGFRGRLMLRTLWTLKEDSPLSLCFSNEYFQNLNTVARGFDSGFDQNRFFLGINYLVTNTIQVEPGYMNVFVDPPGSGNTVMNHVFAVYTIFNL